MAGNWQDFGATNQPDTCAWCGRKLRHGRDLEWVGYGQGDNGGPWKDHGPYALGGSYQDGKFCGLRCGYMFGLQFARGGHTLAPRRPTPTPERMN